VLILTYLFAPRYLGWSELPLPDAVRWLGVTLFFASLVLLVWVHITLGRNFNTTLVLRADHELVVRGPYRYVRHPMYSAFALLFSGMFLLSANVLLGILGGVIFFFLVFSRTPREEAQLAERFGEAYEAYRARTGALWPKFH
jgi:protein-S-isoprenylcysteine O-methyltransferase Ste14